ncbi:MAG TPA: ZIP family metal transporter [Symbiobacteriaceae bacterium]|nr:ZIP family metal transporter [Symbiobacteriaceae bacterium]
MSAIGLMSVLAGMANVLGGWFTLSPLFSKSRMEQLVALGAGFLLGGALLTMLPGALHMTANTPVYVALGYLGLFTARRLSASSGTGKRNKEQGASIEAAWAATLAMGLHSFFDGAAMGTAIRADGRLGATAFVAVFLHKLPEGFSLAALVVSATGSRRAGLLATWAVGLVTGLGALLAYSWAQVVHLPQGALMGIAAGSFLYVGTTDMLPAVPKKGINTWLVLVGVALVYLLTGASGGHSHVH